MLIGIGTDIIEIKRIEEAIKRTPRFVEKIFTEDEREELSKIGNLPQRAAGSFAVKEAVSKALGTGFRTFGAGDIEVIRDAKGKPKVNLYGGAKELATALGATNILVSISHCKDYAVAMVTIEGSDRCESSM